MSKSRMFNANDLFAVSRYNYSEVRQLMSQVETSRLGKAADAVLQLLGATLDFLVKTNPVTLDSRKRKLTERDEQDRLTVLNTMAAEIDRVSHAPKHVLCDAAQAYVQKCVAYHVDQMREFDDPVYQAYINHDNALKTLLSINTVSNKI